MKEKIQKVVIFDRKEILLIITIMLLAVMTSFALGVKVGRHFVLISAGITEKDQKVVELQSRQEHEVKEVTAKGVLTPPHKDQLVDESYKKLQEEFQKIDKEAVTTHPTHGAKEQALKVEKVETAEDHKAKTDQDHPPVVSSGEAKIRKQYTIQLGSFPDQVEAQRFADGIEVKGQKPLVMEVTLEGKGRWYRVSLGMFDNIEEAKEFLKSEESFFEGQKYIITSFD